SRVQTLSHYLHQLTSISLQYFAAELVHHARFWPYNSECSKGAPGHFRLRGDWRLPQRSPGFAGWLDRLALLATLRLAIRVRGNSRRGAGWILEYLPGCGLRDGTRLHSRFQRA